MAWKYDTLKKYNALAESEGGKIIKQIGAQKALILMNCGHSREFSINTKFLRQTKKMRCKVCWAKEQIKEHEQEIARLKGITN